MSDREDDGRRGGPTGISANYGPAGDWRPAPGGRVGTDGASSGDAGEFPRHDWRPREGRGARGGWTGAEGGSFLGDYGRASDDGPDGYYEGRWATHGAYGQGGWGGPGGYGGPGRPNYAGPGRRGATHGFWGGGEFAGGPPDYDTTPHRGPFTGRGPKGWTRSDERIRDDVCDGLTMHGEIDATDVEVKVEGGEVTLSGTVADRRQKRVAEDVADACIGVRDVHNDLRVNRERT